MRPDSPWLAAARSLLELGPAAVLVTDGPAPVTIDTESGERSIPVPVVEVVDTIGAGDAFVAGFLTWWTAHALLQHDAARPGCVGQGRRRRRRGRGGGLHGARSDLPADFRWSTGSGVTETVTPG